MNWLRNAFALDPPGPAVPTEQQRLAVDLLLREVVRRRLVAPATLFLSSLPNLNYLTAQGLHFFAPFAHALISAGLYDALAGFLEHRGSVDYMISRLNELDREASVARCGAAPPQTDADRE